MLAYSRAALVFCAILSATTIAPAQADPFAEPLLPAESEALPTVVTPELLAVEAEPQLSEPADIAPIEGVTPIDEGEPAEVIATPFKPRATLAANVADLRTSDPGSRELECLATGIYFESKSEPLAGQLAVGHVIANRANSGGRFPGSYCGVLFQRGQFSFIRGSSLPSVPRASKQWQTAVAVAKIVDQDLHASPVGKAMFFHARYVSPRWRLKRVAAVGNHIFYR
jgi:spore germination cell wall hydrolase CwlJ-like protein